MVGVSEIQSRDQDHPGVIGFLVIQVMALNELCENWFSFQTEKLERKGCLVLIGCFENWFYFSKKAKVVTFVQHVKICSFCQGGIWFSGVCLKQKVWIHKNSRG